MRIERIIINNFRQYKKVDLVLKSKTHDVHAFVGQNGAGKTTLFNAINWCLYDEEPYIYSSENSTRLLNLDLDSGIVSVELHVRAKNNTLFKYKRSLKFVDGEEKGKSELEVFIVRTSGETNHIKKNELADNEVINFVPPDISEFFFFDGEKLDNYFLSDRAKNIEHNISILSHIDILKRMLGRLDEKQKELKKEAGKLNSNIDEINEKLDVEINARENEFNRRDKLNAEITKANIRIAELDDLLRGVPDIESLENERETLKKLEKNTEDNIKAKEKELNNLFVHHAPSIFSYSLMKEILTDIDKKIEEGQLPTPIDDKIIEESLDKHVCKMCNRDLDKESEEYLNNSLNNLLFSTTQSKLLIKLKTPLTSHINNVNEFNNRKKAINKDLSGYISNLNQIVKSIEEINKQIEGYDDDSIKKWFRERSDLENARETNRDSLVNVKANLKTLNNKISKLEKDLQEAMANDEKTKELKTKRSLCLNALDVVNKTINIIMDDTRKTIEKSTKEIFFDLSWKKKTYGDIILDEYYNLKLINALTGENSLGTASAAERELLALSFTLAVHKISGFDSPLVIDTPLARVSDKHRENFAKVLYEVGKNKQILLLFTPAEFSEDVKSLFNKNKVLDYEITMEDNEIISKINEGYNG